MSAGVLSIVPKKIGEGGLKSGTSVKRLQQLLWMAGYTSVGTADGGWGKKTAAAWAAFQETASYRSQPFVESGDPENRLFPLAFRAGVLIPLTGGVTGAKALQAFYETCRYLKIPYGWESTSGLHGNGSMMTWGLGMNGSVSFGICTRPTSSPTYAVFDTKVPLALNCTSFAQAALSLWHFGNLHNTKYLADQMVGAFVNLSQSRYGYQALPGTDKPPAGVTKFPGLYSSLEELQEQLKAGTLYHFALCKSNGSITHDTVLYDGEVYESNKGGPVTVRKTALAERWKQARNASRYAIVSKPL